MPVEHIEFLVEEPSMETFLSILLPKLLLGISYTLHTFICKTDLLKSLSARLRGYRYWIPEDWRIIVLIDRDKDDCHELKARLEKIAEAEGLVTRSSASESAYTVVNRIVVEELEAWYFGDWDAVRKAFPRVGPRIPRQEKYRFPDAITGGTWEQLEREMKRAGYFKTGLQKIEAARRIAPHIDPYRNSSPSFKALARALAELSGKDPTPYLTWKQISLL